LLAGEKGKVEGEKKILNTILRKSTAGQAATKANEGTQGKAFFFSCCFVA
jgi:hypothetical protein